MKVERVLVVGAGLMGSGIAQVCAQAGLSVSLRDVHPDALDKARRDIAWSAGKLVEKGKVPGPLDAVMARIETTTSLASAAAADLVIEAVFEKRELKQEVFAELDGLAPSHALLASNTSAIPITELAAATAHPERVLGLHFFSPVPMMQLVEVVRGIGTSQATFEAGTRFVRSIGKEPVPVHRDVAGFIVNRINLPSSLEAMRLVEAGVATVEDVDKGLRLGAGRRMGLFETGDLVGLDVTYNALLNMYEETRDPRWYPPMILRRKVRAGHLGRKTGRGWYAYDADGNRIEPEKEEA